MDFLSLLVKKYLHGHGPDAEPFCQHLVLPDGDGDDIDGVGLFFLEFFEDGFHHLARRTPGITELDHGGFS